MMTDWIHNSKKRIQLSEKRLHTTSAMFIFLLISMLMATGCTFAKSSSVDNAETDMMEQESETTYAATETADTSTGLVETADIGASLQDDDAYDNRDMVQTEALFSSIEDEVYRELLKEMLDSGEFPASEGTPYDGNPYENYYAVTDIDGDGQDELLVNFSNGTSMAGMVYYIYDYDRTTGEVYSQHYGFPFMTVYDNGYIKEDASHNHGRSNLDDFWPYLLYKYNPKTDQYESVAFVDAWQSTFHGEGEPDPNFPKEKDINGDGIVYYDMSRDYYDPEWIVDNAEYEKWCEQYNKARVTEIEWSLIITEEEYYEKYPMTGAG